MKPDTKRREAQARAKPSERKTKPKVAPAVKRTSPKSSREKVRVFRERMRAKGLRLVQLWLPDTRELKPSVASKHRRINRDESTAVRKAWAEALAPVRHGYTPTFDDIAHLVGSVDGPKMDLRMKNAYLRATGYGRKRHR